jgi:hypothetical protein
MTTKAIIATVVVAALSAVVTFYVTEYLQARKRPAATSGPTFGGD